MTPWLEQETTITMTNLEWAVVIAALRALSNEAKRTGYTGKYKEEFEQVERKVNAIISA